MSEGHVGRTKMIPDFETMDKITKLSPNEHWFEVENMQVLKVLNCFIQVNVNTGQKVKPNPVERTAKLIRTILNFSTFCAMTSVLYVHSFVATDFWITLLPIVLCEERFFCQRPDRKTRDMIYHLCSCVS